jgi:protoporphyrinogen oxidase
MKDVRGGGEFRAIQLNVQMKAQMETQVNQRTAIIIGAGPAGLTAGIELIRRSGIKPIILESSHSVGGLSRTVVYNGNRMDIGGHRFFSKSDRVMQWWLDVLPIEAGGEEPGELRYRGHQRGIPAAPSKADPNVQDRVMLVRQRKSRIYFLRRFFDYPIRLTAGTLMTMGLIRTIRCGCSYLWATLRPRRPERTLEDFFINRFGKQLYEMFYKSYSEKVWGVTCDQISADWGAQRIKGLSLKSVAAHYLKSILSRKGRGDINQSGTETSLIEKFLYPKFGPGQLWEQVADQIRSGGGEIHFGVAVDRILTQGGQVVSVVGTNDAGERVAYRGDSFFSTMPVRDLIRGMGSDVPDEVKQVSEDLHYRDFIIAGLLVKKLAVSEKDGSPLKDNWIYIQEPGVKVGRLQIFNNWSPWLVSRPDRMWIGLEYFCNETDAIWKLSDEALAELAIDEAARIGILDAGDVEDSHIVRVPKSYPSYIGSYSRFKVIRDYTDGFTNLFLVGRNGMHMYNNQDHSMLTAMTAVENIVNDVATKDNIWAINTEMEYQEEIPRRGPSRETSREATEPPSRRKIAVAGTAVE